MTPNRTDDESLEVVVDGLMGEAELEPIPEMLGGLISEGEETGEFRVCKREAKRG